MALSAKSWDTDSTTNLEMKLTEKCFQNINFSSLSPWMYVFDSFYHTTAIHCFEESNCGISRPQLVKLVEQYLKQFPKELCNIIATYAFDSIDMIINEFISQLQRLSPSGMSYYQNTNSIRM